MAKSMEGKNPVQDSGFSLGLESAGKTFVGYMIWFVMILVAMGSAAWVYTTGKNAAGMDEESTATLTVN